MNNILGVSMKKIRELIERNRSYRRFDEARKLTKDVLLQLIDNARISSSAANRQPLKYIISCTDVKNKSIFPFLKWAGYLKDWNGPVEGERPTAYIIMVHDKEIGNNVWWDHGIAAENILLSAVEMGLGGCMLGAIDKNGLKKALGLEEQYEVLMVIALGKPAEKVVLEEIGNDGDIKYYRDGSEVHHVPKRSLDEIIIE